MCYSFFVDLIYGFFQTPCAFWGHLEQLKGLSSSLSCIALKAPYMLCTALGLSQGLHSADKELLVHTARSFRF